MKYFNLSELSASATAERLAIDNTPPRAARRMLTILVEQLLDPIRRRYGAPIIVTSGYRCPALNTAVGGVTNSHHIVGCAADITAPLCSQAKLLDVDKSTAVVNAERSTRSRTDAHLASAPQGGKNQTAHFLSSPLGGSEGGRGDQTLSLFHLIIQMQREGAIRFTQLIAEKDYRWLHISYVPGMLRNQIIDVNACASERDASSLAIAQRTQPSVCDEVTNDNQPSGRQLSSSSSLTLKKSKSALTLKKDYQDSG